MIGSGSTTDRVLTQAGKVILGDDYCGTFAKDELPDTEFKYAILNLDTRKDGGTHWVALAQVDKDTYMIYDSFGRKTAQILPRLQLNTIDTEHDAEQTVKQNNCGARSLAWLMLFDELGPEAAKSI